MTKTMSGGQSARNVRLAGLATALAMGVASLTGCGAVNAALTEGSTPGTAVTAAVFTKDLYLIPPPTTQYGGASPDPSGSLSLSDGDMTWAQSAQAMLASAIKNRIPALPATDSDFALGASGVPALVMLYMPVASKSGSWAGDASSIEIRIRGVPGLKPQPQPDKEADVPGRTGKGAAWDQAKAAYIAAHDAAVADAEAAAQQIANFPLRGQDSDIYGSVNLLAERLTAISGGAGGWILTLSDLEDTGATPGSASFANFTVTAVQACTRTAAVCDGYKQAFINYITAAGGSTPTVLGHESARSIINTLLASGG